jgi:hypothetical protein
MDIVVKLAFYKKNIFLVGGKSLLEELDFLLEVFFHNEDIWKSQKNSFDSGSIDFVF